MLRAVSFALAIGLLSGCLATTHSKQEPVDATEWPATCDDAISRLSTELPQSEKAKLAAMARDELIQLHLGFGMGIRNEFGLWVGNFALIESCSGSPATHPDDVSMTIIERLWDDLQ